MIDPPVFDLKEEPWKRVGRLALVHFLCFLSETRRLARLFFSVDLLLCW